jgi:dnd system-associated protein 4
MDRRIAAASTYTKFLDDLVNVVPGEEYALFETKQKALMFAAALGHRSGRRTPGNRDASAAIRFDIFEKALDDAFVYCLGIKEFETLQILGDANVDDLATMFEEYANTGLAELQKKVVGQPNPLDALVDLMLAARNPSTEEGLEGLDADVLAEILGR